jgi:CheY-like chemotaxis protein
VQVVEREDEQQQILIVEDEADIQSLMTFVLERAGYDAVAVASVAEARAAISLFEFDVALVDLSLPDGRGDEVVDMLRTASPQTRIVITSALIQTNIVPAFAADIGDAFLPKPFKRADLIATVASRPCTPAPSA